MPTEKLADEYQINVDAHASLEGYDQDAAIRAAESKGEWF